MKNPKSNHAPATGDHSDLLAKLLAGCTPVSTSSTNIMKFEKAGDAFSGYFKEIRPYEKNGETWERLVFLDVEKKSEWLLPNHKALRDAVESNGLAQCFYHIVYQGEETFGKKTKTLYKIVSNKDAAL